VRAIGTVDIYNGDTEIQFFEAEMVQVITPDGYDAIPLPLTTADAGLESNEGWLVTVTGEVVDKVGNDTLIVDDGSGPIRVFLDGYNGDFDDIRLRYVVQVIGLASEDGNGARIRIRNHDFHLDRPEDVIVSPMSGYSLYIPIVIGN